MPLPQPEELTLDQALLTVEDYDLHDDTFAVTLQTADVNDTVHAQKSLVPACLMPKLTGQYGAPDEFVGQTFLVGPDPTVRLIAKAKECGWQERPDGKIVHEVDQTRPHPALFDSWEHLFESWMRYATARL